METSSSILFITLCIYFNTDWAFSQDHEALVIITNFPSPLILGDILPYTAVESNGRIIYPDFTTDGKKIEYSYFCPTRTPHGVEIKKQITDDFPNFPEFSFSLEENPSTMEPTKCEDEVEPILTKNRHPIRFPNKCGGLSDHVPYDFAFSYLKSITDHSNITPLIEIQIATVVLYEVCFDKNESKMLWTKHNVRTGYMLRNSGFPSQQIQPPYDYSTESYALPQNIFFNVAKAYETQDPDARYKMIPQMLVPQEDFALKIWKKTTKHRVNTAPLWENFVPLMKAINDGIRKAGIRVSLNTFKTDTQQSDDLDIYTVAYSRDRFDEWAKKVNFSKTKQFGLNIWCKLVYYESQNKGVMIYLHNLPDLPPRKINSTSTDSTSEISLLENTECETPVRCNIQNWSDEPAGLSDNILNYAYCCEVDNDKVEELFNIRLNNNTQLLKLDHIMT